MQNYFCANVLSFLSSELLKTFRLCFLLPVLIPFSWSMHCVWRLPANLSDLFKDPDPSRFYIMRSSSCETGTQLKREWRLKLRRSDEGKNKRDTHKREERRKGIQGDNLVMYFFWAIFSPESCLAIRPVATMGEKTLKRIAQYWQSWEEKKWRNRW